MQNLDHRPVLERPQRAPGSTKAFYNQATIAGSLTNPTWRFRVVPASATASRTRSRSAPPTASATPKSTSGTIQIDDVARAAAGHRRADGGRRGRRRTCSPFTGSATDDGFVDHVRVGLRDPATGMWWDPADGLERPRPGSRPASPRDGSWAGSIDVARARRDRSLRAAGPRHRHAGQRRCSRRPSRSRSAPDTARARHRRSRPHDGPAAGRVADAHRHRDATRSASARCRSRSRTVTPDSGGTRRPRPGGRIVWQPASDRDARDAGPRVVVDADARRRLLLPRRPAPRTAPATSTPRRPGPLQREHLGRSTPRRRTPPSSPRPRTRRSPRRRRSPARPPTTSASTQGAGRAQGPRHEPLVEPEHTRLGRDRVARRDARQRRAPPTTAWSWTPTSAPGTATSRPRPGTRRSGSTRRWPRCASSRTHPGSVPWVESFDLADGTKVDTGPHRLDALDHRRASPRSAAASCTSRPSAGPPSGRRSRFGIARPRRGATVHVTWRGAGHARPARHHHRVLPHRRRTARAVRPTQRRLRARDRAASRAPIGYHHRGRRPQLLDRQRRSTTSSASVDVAHRHEDPTVTVISAAAGDGT